MADQPESSISDFLGKTAADLGKIWTRLPPQVRVLMLVVIVLVVAGSVVLAVADRTEEEVLFSGLTSEDAAAIVEHLKGKHVLYRIKGDGGTIMVPKEQVHELRLALATEGLPVGGGIGFELFDQQRFGMTEFEERVALRRALEGELSRTIGRIDAVRSARVHLVLPKRSILSSKSVSAQSSIVIEMQKGRELSGGSVRAIVHLVSSSVEGLNPDQVTVVDTRGRLLSSEAGLGFNSKEFEYQHQFERDIELRLYEMLSQTIGPESSVVRVAANFDFSRRETTEEHYDPERSVLRSEQREVESSGSRNTGAGGTPGSRSNLPGGTQPVSSAGGQNKKREAETRNYEVDKVVNRVISPSAALTRVSVTVLVNGTNEQADTFVARSPEELHKIELAVRGAIGFDTRRGDSVEVQSVPFHVPEEMEAPGTFGPPWWKEWLPLAMGGAVALVLIFVILSMRKGRSKSKVEVESLPLPRNVRELEAIIERPKEMTQQALAAVSDNQEAQSLTSALMGEVRQHFLEESEGSSRVIKSWLSEAPKPEDDNKQAEEVTA